MNLDTSFEKVRDQALSLTPKERAALARDLLETLGEPSKEELAARWVEEAERRLELIGRGDMRVVSGEEVRRRVRNIP